MPTPEQHAPVDVATGHEHPGDRHGHAERAGTVPAQCLLHRHRGVGVHAVEDAEQHRMDAALHESRVAVGKGSLHGQVQPDRRAQVLIPVHPIKACALDGSSVHR